MSMREKAKSMWEKSQMSVGKAMSSAVTNLAGYVSSMWNKNSEPENPGNLLTGVPISVPKPMEGNEVGDKPVEITNTNINEQGDVSEAVGKIIEIFECLTGENYIDKF